MISSSHQLWLKSQLHNQRQHFQMYPHLSPNLPCPYESSQSKPLFKDCLYKVVMNNQKTKDKKNVQTGTPREGSLVSNTSLESCPLIISSRLLSLNISQHKLCWRLSPCWGSSTIREGNPNTGHIRSLCCHSAHGLTPFPMKPQTPTQTSTQRVLLVAFFQRNNLLEFSLLGDMECSPVHQLLWDYLDKIPLVDFRFWGWFREPKWAFENRWLRTQFQTLWQTSIQKAHTHAER